MGFQRLLWTIGKAADCTAHIWCETNRFRTLTEATIQFYYNFSWLSRFNAKVLISWFRRGNLWDCFGLIKCLKNACLWASPIILVYHNRAFSKNWSTRCYCKPVQWSLVQWLLLGYATAPEVKLKTNYTKYNTFLKLIFSPNLSCT